MEMGNLIFGHSRGRYPVPRGFEKGTWEWQDRFGKFFNKFGLEYHGICCVKPSMPGFWENNRGGLMTPIFEIWPYWWGDESDEVECGRANFIYHPTGYELRWYKYPLRDSYANQDLTYEEFDRMLSDCEAYLGE